MKVVSVSPYAGASSSRLPALNLVSQGPCDRDQIQQLSVRAQRFLLPLVGGIFCICFAWTLWLIALTVSPNRMVNFIMRTAEFDNGDFWAIIQPSATVVGLGISGLSIVLAGYLFVGVKVLAWGKRAIVPVQFVTKAREFGSNVTSLASFPKRVSMQASTQWSPRVIELPPLELPHQESRVGVKALSAPIIAVAADLVQETTLTRKYANVCLKLGNLALQLAVLYLTSEAGYPLVLVGMLVTAIIMNSLTCVIIIYFPREVLPITEDLLDFAFDLAVAVFFPMAVLGYCVATFKFDREAYAINLEFLIEGHFHRSARIFSHPADIAIIHQSLGTLRISSFFDFCARVGANLVLCYRFHCVVSLLHDPKRRQASLYPRKHPVAIVFVVVAVAAIAFVGKSVRHTQAACAPFPECVVHAHRWNTADLEDGSGRSQCPCLVLIDVDLAPKTFEEWVDPKDATLAVAQLAASGDLKAIQLINRKLTHFPEELRRCKGLQMLSFVYSNVHSLPSWAREFTKLELLHIEGSAGISSLDTLPLDLFDNMGSLTFLHLGFHQSLSQLPSFHGLLNLKTLTLALLGSLEELPDLSHQKKLSSLMIAATPLLEGLPDLESVSATLSLLALLGHERFCCNGFLGTTCDLSNERCGVDTIWGTPPASCLSPSRSNQIATPATAELIGRFWNTTCGGPMQRLTPNNRHFDEMVTAALVHACNGTMYRQCVMPESGMSGMCFNSRFMPISCSSESELVEIRRRQIAMEVGDTCDPEHEAWLGCNQ